MDKRDALQQNFDETKIIGLERFVVPDHLELHEIRRLRNDANNFFRAFMIFLLEKDFMEP